MAGKQVDPPLFGAGARSNSSSFRKNSSFNRHSPRGVSPPVPGQKIKESSSVMHALDVMGQNLAKEDKNRSAKDIVLGIKQNAEAWVKDPWFQTVTISTGSGAVILGSVGGAFGTASGIVIGTTAGALPALFTFGLSLPVGAAAGGCLGFGSGALAGGAAGGVCGGAAGHGAYCHRVEIRNGLIMVTSKISNSAKQAKLKIIDEASNVKTSIKTATLAAKAKIYKGCAKIDAVAHDPRVQVSAVSAVAGAAVCAPVGGVVGACSGTVIGGAVGMVPALFTFGLSIPVCAAVGGGLGLCTGTVAGGSVGAAGTGSLAFGAYTYRKPIQERAQEVQKQVKGSAQNMKAKAIDSYSKAREVVSARLSGTGGTA